MQTALSSVCMVLIDLKNCPKILVTASLVVSDYMGSFKPNIGCVCWDMF